MQAVAFTNDGTKTVTVAGVSVSGDFAQTSACSAVAPGASCVVQVTFTPTALGARAGSLNINDNAPGNPHTVSLSGSGTAGAAPAITSLAPGRSPAGAAGLALLVSGSGFVSGSVVNWNGTPRATTFVGASQPPAAISA